MPTIAELIRCAKAPAGRTEFSFGGAKVTIERRRVDEAVAGSVAIADKGREEYFRMRDFVWKTLRTALKEYEAFQRYLKDGDLRDKDKLYRRMIARAKIENTAKLRMLYRVIEFTRRGMAVDGAEETEKFFNEFFHGKIEFRNAYWTYWNRKHNKTAFETSASTKKPFRCPECNRFVSRKTNFCANCGKTVHEK